MQPPRAAKRPHPLEAHGHVRHDDYFWLNQRDNPEVVAHLQAENEYASAVLAPCENLRLRLLDEMRSRIPGRQSTAPFREGDYFYYLRYEEGQEYPVFCRRACSANGGEQLLLDVNAVADGHDYCDVGAFEVSPDQRYAVLAVDFVGRRFYTLRFLDLENGRFLERSIPDVTDNVQWAADSRTVLYARQDPETLRDFQVLRHTLGSGKDALVFEDGDETYWVSVEKSLSGRFLYIVSAATLTTEVRYLSALEPAAEPRLFQAREEGHEYYVTDGGDRFFVLSNHEARNFRVFETFAAGTDRAHWRELVGHRAEVLIEGIEVFRDHVVLAVTERALPRFEVLDRADAAIRRIGFDEAVYGVEFGDNHVYEAATLRVDYESLTTPHTVIDIDLADGSRGIVWQQEVPGGFDPQRYRAERLFVEARDGASVPVSMVYRPDLRRDGGNPLLLYGYGAYGISVEASFDGDRVSLLDRGFIFAIAHVRGGSELGRDWYRDGREFRKRNSFNDFIDVARYLQGQGYTTPRQCYARGGSAGGLLVAAVMNMAPELFRGVSTRVPFVDIVTSMLDTSLPLTTGEYDEWGDPGDPDCYRYMLSYSPYDNVRARTYPNLLVTTGLHDSQVQYWEPAKWVARLRDLDTGDALILLHTDMQAGHSGKTGRYRSLEDSALAYTFLLMLEGEPG
ncbi:MAG: S9 family peptidase [Gammaproteobacteria bacterium]|nr:S9 family peptidase [Gammaproteobacteria bacterium]MDH4254031.1 S9 family peptidase [Gammaproteobacteria bacterium]MDH5310330.1 S9 family peptidase [Gammaproteobacteria bacterium]